MSTIGLHEVWFHYNEASEPALRNLSLEIPSACVFGVLGPNGSGKTTLLYLMLGLHKPQRGAVLIDGQPHLGMPKSDSSRLMGLVPEREHVPFDFPVTDYVLLGRAPHLGLLQRPGHQDRVAAQAALEATGIAHLALRPFTSLSGGERQLATLARALAQKPRILLLDEPTSHLDLSNKDRVLRVIRALRDEGVTVVLTTHDPNGDTAVTDHVALMRGGTVVAAGPTQQVLTAQNLTTAYGLPVQVAFIQGRPVVLTPLGEDVQGESNG
jgi:iron complex transport system ATP-binding protein